MNKKIICRDCTNISNVSYKFPYRSCLESLHKLSLPPQALDRIKKLAGDLRLLCAKEVFKEAIEGTLSTLESFFVDI